MAEIANSHQYSDTEQFDFRNPRNMKRKIIMTLAILLLITISLILFCEGRKEASQIRTRLESK